MHEARCALEDDGVGQLDIPREAVGLDADAARDGCDGADGRTQRQRGRVTDVGEVPEAAHVVDEDDGRLATYSTMDGSETTTRWIGWRCAGDGDGEGKFVASDAMRTRSISNGTGRWIYGSAVVCLRRADLSRFARTVDEARAQVGGKRKLTVCQSVGCMYCSTACIVCVRARGQYGTVRYSTVLLVLISCM